jgi:hypothetical protein
LTSGESGVGLLPAETELDSLDHFGDGLIALWIFPEKQLSNAELTKSNPSPSIDRPSKTAKPYSVESSGGDPKGFRASNLDKARLKRWPEIGRASEKPFKRPVIGCEKVCRQKSSLKLTHPSPKSANSNSSRYHETHGQCTQRVQSDGEESSLIFDAELCTPRLIQEVANLRPGSNEVMSPLSDPLNATEASSSAIAEASAARSPEENGRSTLMSTETLSSASGFSNAVSNNGASWKLYNAQSSSPSSGPQFAHRLGPQYARPLKQDSGVHGSSASVATPSPTQHPLGAGDPSSSCHPQQPSIPHHSVSRPVPPHISLGPSGGAMITGILGGWSNSKGSDSPKPLNSGPTRPTTYISPYQILTNP